MEKVSSILATLILFLTVGVSFVWYQKRSRSSEGKEESVIIVGTNAEYPPYAFMDNGIVVGFDIAVIKHVAHALNKKIEIKDMPFDALIPAAQLGQVQVIAAGITPTAERKQRLLFTNPHHTGDPLLIISNANNELKTVEALKGNRVVVNEGFTADYYMSALQGPKITRLSSVTEGFMALRSKLADAFVVAQSAAQPFFEQHGKRGFSIANIPNTSEHYALAISPRHKELLPLLQEILDLMAQDGTMDALKQKWGLVP